MTASLSTDINSGRRSLWERVWQNPYFGIVVIFLLSFAFSASQSPTFLTLKNLESAMLVFFVELAIAAMAQALVILVKGIDLSLGGIFGLVSVAVALLYQAGVNIFFATLLGLLLGAGCGLINGVLITRMRTPPFIATMGSGLLFYGIALGITAGRPISIFPPEYLWLGRGHIGPIPTQLVIAGLILIAGTILLSYTRFGRWVYAIGGNEVAAHFSGIPVHRAIVAIYMTSGILAGITAVITSARFNSAKVDLGANIELATVTAALLGGVAIEGGKGTLLGAVLGMLTIATLQNGLLLINVQDQIQLMVIAVLLILVVIWNNFVAQRRIG